MNTIETIHTPLGIGSGQRIAMPYGVSIADIAQRVHRMSDDLIAWVKAPDGSANEWIEVPRYMWRLIKPKINDAVMFGYRSGNSILKSVLSIVAAVLVAIIAPYLAPIIGSTLAGLAAAAIGIGAQIGINALFPPEQQAFASRDVEAARQFSNVESDSNVLAKEAYLPIVAGTRRLSPPEIAAPFFFLENGIQSIQRVFALDGHHSLTDIQVDRAPVSDFASITTEVQDGAEVTPVTTFVDKVTKSIRVGETLSTFSLDDLNLVDQVEPANSEPRYVRFTTAASEKLEEISIRMQLDSFAKTDSTTQAIRVPLRIRFRVKGSNGAWFYLPEIHLVGRDISTGLKEIRLRWDDQFGASDSAGDITYEFFQRVPASTRTLSDGSTGDQWQADSHFVADTGLKDTQNIQGYRNGLRIVLDEAIYSKVEYEWEIKRGIALNSNGLNASYQISGVVESLFVAKSASAQWNIPVDQGAYVSRVSIAQATSIANQHPCNKPKTAIIAVKAVGQSVSNITVNASRYVYDWDGSGWNTLTTTKNPATHARQIISDYLDHHGISQNLIANDEFVGWRAECEARGYEVSAVIAGSSILEALDAIAVAGFARRRASIGFGVDWFRDLSNEKPRLTFSPRNAAISLEFASLPKPLGVRAKFQNENDEYRDDEALINNTLYTNSPGYQVATYSSITKPELVTRRADFDLLQEHYRGRRSWTVESGPEAFMLERGTLIGVVSDLVSDSSSGARIREVINANTFRIDQDIPTQTTESIFDADNLFDSENIFREGSQSVCMFTTDQGSEFRIITAAADGVIRVDENLPDIDLNGSHIAIGPSENFTSRCVVSEVQRQGEERATLICVDEAPEIFNTLQEKYG